jgi:hypothetical protein
VELESEEEKEAPRSINKAMLLDFFSNNQKLYIPAPIDMTTKFIHQILDGKKKLLPLI